MELLFIDESGDNGFAPGSTSLFILGGVCVPAHKWKGIFWKIEETKREITKRYGIKVPEIKTSKLFAHRGVLFDTQLQQEDMLWIYDRFVDLLCDSSVTLLVGGYSKEKFKQQGYSTSEAKHLTRAFTEHVWRRYFYELEDLLAEKTKQTEQPQNAIVYYDSNPGHEKYIRRIVREFSRKDDATGVGIVEDIILRDSKTSHLIQLADVLAYSVAQMSSRRPVIPSVTGKRLTEKIQQGRATIEV